MSELQAVIGTSLQSLAEAGFFAGLLLHHLKLGSGDSRTTKWGPKDRYKWSYLGALFINGRQKIHG